MEQQSKEQMEASLSEEINNLRTALGVAKSRLCEIDQTRKICSEKDMVIQQQRAHINDLEVSFCFPYYAVLFCTIQTFEALYKVLFGDFVQTVFSRMT